MLMAFGLALGACGGGDTSEGVQREPSTSQEGEPPAKSAIAMVMGVNQSKITGTAILSEMNGAVVLVVNVAGATPGEHAVHIHENPDCSNEAMAAGGHWNPTGVPHGQWGVGEYHLGDIGNMTVDDSGMGTLTLESKDWSIGTGQPNDVTKHAIVIHEDADDFSSQPSGAAGKRVACGVITLQ